MPKNFIKKKPSQKLGYRTTDSFKRNKRWSAKTKPQKIFSKSQALKGGQHRV